MEREDIIEEIDRVIKLVYLCISKEEKSGLCEISNMTHGENIQLDMVSYARMMGICKSGYWWDKDKSNSVEEWYAPRIAFLEAWKAYLIHGEKTLFGDGNSN